MAMAKRAEWRANRGPQRWFIRCPVREILYGGAKGGGKTEGVCPKAVKHVLKWGHLGGAVLILRENFPQLGEIQERIKPWCLRARAKYHKQSKTWRFPNGGRIIFGHLEDGCDPYWGQEYTMIVVDEITRSIATEVEYLKLLGSLRSSHGVPCQVIVTSNPGGEGHAWVKARFMGVPPLTVQKDPKSGLERVFIPARLKDNPNLPAEYRATLEELPDAERAAFLDGDWDAFEGSVFKLVRGVHYWTIAQFFERTGLKPPEDGKPWASAIPSSWLRYRSYDHGHGHPGAAYWYAVAPGGRAFAYRELYTAALDARGQVIPNEGARMAPEDVAGLMVEYSEGEKYAADWTGPDLFAEVRQDQKGGVKISTHFANKGIHFKAWAAGDGSRRAGKMALVQRLAYPKHDNGAPKDWPHLVFIEEACPQAIRTIPALDRDPNNPELWDKRGEDHAVDSVCGFCKMAPWEPVVKVEESCYETMRRNAKKTGTTWMGA